MLFTSLEFLILFLPIACGAFFLLPRDEDGWNVWLLLVSLLFYAWGEPTFVLVMLLSIILNYGMGRLIAETKDGKKQRRFLILTVGVNLGILLAFKYLNFLIGVIHDMLPFTRSFLPETHVPLPIGISFFTFQAMSYVIDVYRGTQAQKSIANFGLYVSFFPQLIAGPIVRYTTVMGEIQHRERNWDNFSQGMLRFMRGFNKKVLLSNVLSQVAEEAFSAAQLSQGMAWLGALAYTFQIFFDFSGYSDMAIGLGRVFGFHFMENFDYPYVSKTVTEFWRRWHISLGSWFRDYVYFPLGGSRVKSKWRLAGNLLAVWCLTGMWHGANWTFILWGLLYGVVIIAEKLMNVPKRMQRAAAPVKILGWIVTMLLVMLGWVLFNSADLPAAGAYLRAMFRGNGPALDTAFFHALREYRVYWIAAALCTTPLFKTVRSRLCARGGRAALAAETGAGLWQLILFLFSVSCLVISAHNPFIYFNF